MFDQFTRTTWHGGDVPIHYRTAGSGPPVLLVHGYPQSHVMWHRIAPALAERFTVVCPDLRGYGDSGKPAGDAAHETYSKRAMAADLIGLMTHLGHDRFAWIGHDRGARVGHRAALDHPERIDRLAVLDIVPTHAVFRAADRHLATAYYHWFFMLQEDGLPERMIGADPVFYMRSCLAKWSRRADWLDPAAEAEYARCFNDPAAVHATCEDYRAAASCDFAHDEADFGRRTVACPVLALWGGRGFVGRAYDVPAVWRQYAADVAGTALDCGHFLPEEAPGDTLAHLQAFLSHPGSG